MLVILDAPASRDEKLDIAARIRIAFSRDLIDADVLVRSTDDVEAYRDMPGSVVRHAMQEGIEV